MRQIRFRVWDKQCSEMTYGAERGIFGCVDFEDMLAEPSRYVLQQFTGLHDNAGKEIWEGDTVEGTIGDEGAYLPTVGEVEYDVAFGAFGLRNQAGLTLFHNHAIHTFRVIGNIYENPELLSNDVTRTAP